MYSVTANVRLIYREKTGWWADDYKGHAWGDTKASLVRDVSAVSPKATDEKNRDSCCVEGRSRGHDAAQEASNGKAAESQVASALAHSWTGNRAGRTRLPRDHTSCAGPTHRGYGAPSARACAIAACTSGASDRVPRGWASPHLRIMAAHPKSASLMLGPAWVKPTRTLSSCGKRVHRGNAKGCGARRRAGAGGNGSTHSCRPLRKAHTPSDPGAQPGDHECGTAHHTARLQVERVS